MITSKQFIGAAAFGLASFVTTAATAQDTADSDYAGLLGKRYYGLDFTLADYRDNLDNGYGGSMTANLPISSVVDFRSSYHYNIVNGEKTDLEQHALQFDAVYYSRNFEYYTPFITGGLGYGWDSWEFSGPVKNDNDEGFFFAIGAGVEVPFNEKTAGFGSISFRDGVNSDTEDSWGLELGVNHWATSNTSIKASVYIVEDDSVTFRIGFRTLF